MDEREISDPEDSIKRNGSLDNNSAILVRDPAESSPTEAHQDVEKLDNAVADTSTPNDPYLVNWNGPEDPENPQNFSFIKKWLMTFLFSTLTTWVTFSTSVFSATVLVTAKEFHVSTEVTTLATSLNILGFAIGPLVWGPMSELFGRLKPLYFGYTLFNIFQVPVAVAPNLQTLIICRFLSGFFAVSSLAIIGGSMADFWGPVDRAIAISIFSGATFIGPIFGPIIGGFIVDSTLGWRWTAWITSIPAATCGIICLLVIPETYHPILLQKRAARKRKETGNKAYHSLLDTSAPTLHTIVSKYLSRPFQMLLLEPILISITLYVAFIYGILYLFFEAYPISFGEVRGWKSTGVAALPLIAILIGVLLGVFLISYTTKVHYSQKQRDGRATPEDRLPPMMLGAVALPVGLFWFAWTSNPGISWVPQVMAGVPIGLGIMMIWMQGVNYLVDVYLMTANSALSANALIRSTTGAAFPLFATAMYHRLGVNWATSLLGFISVAMVPIPVIFYFYGARIRALSRFVPKR